MAVLTWLCHTGNVVESCILVEFRKIELFSIYVYIRSSGAGLEPISATPAMSFGFSVGDFLAVGKLIASITNSLREAGGSKSEYQELVRELESLDHALKHLDALPLNGVPASLESNKYAALSCRRPLEQFLGKIERYEKSLGIWGGANPLRKTADKFRWAFEEKDEMKKLQSYLSIHIGTINILLAEYGLERMNLASENL